MELVTKNYLSVLRNFLRTKNGLTHQIKRSAVSIPPTIAEGAARRSQKEFMQFLRMSQGSLSELNSHVVLAKHLEYFRYEYWTVPDVEMVQIDKMLTELIHHQEAKVVE